MKILYVEDNPRDADLAIRQFRKTAPHFEIETASTFGEASARLTRLNTAPLDLVLTDVHLRDGDGLALLKQIRERDLRLAVVVITGSGDEETAVAALKAGADDYITKGKDYLARLHLTLENAVQHYRRNLERHSRPLRVLYAEHDLRDVDLTRRHFKRHAGHIHMDVAPTGREAVQLLQSTKEDGRYHVFLLDYRLPGYDALELLKELRMQKLDIPVVLVTGHGSEEVALQAMKLGASNYLVKNPGYLYQLPAVLESANFRAEVTRREEKLRDSRNRYQLATVAGGVGVWDWDVETGQMFLDPHLKALLGYRDDEIANDWSDWRKLLHPDDVSRVLEGALAHIGGETSSYEMEHRVLHKDGTIRWFLTRGAIASRDSGKTTCIVGTSVDISERKRTEEYLHQLTARLFKLQDEERRRIARELHDQTSQNLAAIAVNHARLLQNKSIQEPKVRRIIEDCQMLGEQALKEIRTLSFLLHPPLLDEAGLVSALRWYINGFAKRSGLVVDLIMSGKPERLPSDVEIALFRIVQESLTNIHRHSGSNTASITLQRKDDAVILEIKDQGRGLSSEQVLSANDEIGELGVGIPGMRQRMRQLGGNLEVNSSALGTTIRASVPLNTPSKVDHYSAQA